MSYDFGYYEMTTMTNVDDKKSLGSPKKKEQQGCPCCSFDLFLPDSEKIDPTIEQQRRLAEKEENKNDDDDDDDDDDNNGNNLPGIIEAATQLMSYSTGTDIGIVIVDTHGHAQLDRDRDETYHLSSVLKQNHQQQQQQQQPRNKILVKSLACSVEPDDFDITLKYAATSDFILPALGVHPWYIPNLTSYDNNDTDTDNDIDTDGSFDVDIDIDWLLPLEELLMKHPKCLVGEIGLCKIAKWVRKHPKGKSFAMSIQKRIFKKQLLLAAKLRRPVSVHCVNCHGIFVDTIKEIINNNNNDDENNNKSQDNNSRLRRLLPPVIGMHSFTGTAHHVKELLELERQIVSPFSSSKVSRKRNKTKIKKSLEQQQQQGAPNSTNSDEEKEDPSSSQSSHNKPIFYFGFSHSVNYAMCTSEKSRKKGKEAVQAVPLNRLLVESDVHSPEDVAGGTIGAISYITWALLASSGDNNSNSNDNNGENDNDDSKFTVKDIASITSKNGLTFLDSLD